MKKSIRNLPLYGILMAVGFGMPGSAWSAGTTNNFKAIPFKTVDSGTYQTFIQNWDEEEKPVICAWIRSTSDWSKLFQPAVTMFNKSPAAPPDSFYSKKQFLVVARVVTAPNVAEQGQVFTAQNVTKKEGMLQLNYEFKQPTSNAPFTIKEYLLVKVSKKSYSSGTVQFIENGKIVCEVTR
ncbi:hypothetical protein GN109_12360 [Collimonas pratensis]|uniref:hypothetical protein n=1 Tax=Collimonas pratensis TaxID=279113 RepID=UPI00143DAACC|nr:hypothetical protein [Collimonas pratensis]NKI70216.1 hypothetical protein [Collimonas pratensis]